MSNASSKPVGPPPPEPNQSSIQKFLFYNPHSGAFALAEFLVLGTLGALFSHPIAIHLGIRPVLFVASFTAFLLFVIHTVVTIRRRVWDPWFSVLSVLLIYFLAQAIAWAVIYIYPLARGWSELKGTSWLSNSAIAQFLYFFLATGLTLGAMYGYVRLFRIKLATIGLRRPRWSDLLYGLIAVPFYFILYLLSVALISHLFPGFDVNQKQQLGFDTVHGSVQLALTFISLVLLPPILEEIMVRGLLYTSLKKALPMAGAVLLTSAIFASAHLPEGGTTGPLYVAALDTFVLSIVLIYLREKTNGLWSSMTLHALKNGIAFTVLFVFHTH